MSGAVSFGGQPATRAPNGKFAKPVSPPDIREAPPVLTATQQMLDVAAQRAAHGGFVVPMPPGLDAATLVPNRELGGPEMVPDATSERAMAWLKEIAAIGSPQDLMLAWQYWRPLGTLTPKYVLEQHFLALQTQAGMRWAELERRAEAEQLPARVLAELRSNLRQVEEQLLRERQRYVAPLEQRVASLRAGIAKLEAEQS